MGGCTFVVTREICRIPQEKPLAPGFRYPLSTLSPVVAVLQVLHVACIVQRQGHAR